MLALVLSYTAGKIVMAQKVRYFEFELVKEITIKKVDVTDNAFPFSVNSKNEVFIYSKKGKSLLSSNGKIIDITYMNDSIRKKFYPTVKNFSFINDSQVFIIYNANEQTWNEDANVIYNFQSHKIMNELNFEHLGFINNVEMPLHQYHKFDSRHYNFFKEVYPFDHYYPYDSSFILTFSGSNVPFDSIMPTKKGTLVKLKPKPKPSYSYSLSLENLDSNYLNYKFDNGMAEFWNFVPEKCKFDSFRILLSYPTISDLVILNTKNGKIERRKYTLGNLNIAENSISKRSNKILYDSINFFSIQYNSELNYIIRDINIPASRSANGNAIFLQVISDTFGNIIGIENRANFHTTTAFFKNNFHFGQINETDSTYLFGMYKVKWLDSIYQIKSGLITNKDLTSKYAELYSYLTNTNNFDTIPILKNPFGCESCKVKLIQFLKSASLKPNANRLIILVNSTRDSLEIVNASNSNMLNNITIINVNNWHFNALIPSYNCFLILDRAAKSLTFKKVESINSLFSLISDFSIDACIKIK